MAGVFSFFQKKSAASVKFYVNNVVADWWNARYDNSDTSNAGIIKTAEYLPDVYLITDYISQIVSNIPIKFETRAGKESKNEELRRLVSEPNYYQNWKELIKQFTAYYEILGNSYLYGIKPDGMNMISGLHVLPAGHVGIVLLHDKQLPDWLNEVALYKVTLSGKDYNLLPEAVLHKRNISLRYDSGAFIYGISKYIPGNKITTELKAIYDAKTSIISQRGALGILSNESEIPDADESKDIKLKLQEKFGLGATQDKFIVTTQKLSWQQMSMGIAELQIIENAKYSFAKLCQLNGFDPVIFSTEGSTFANKSEAEKALMKKVIKPKADDLYNDLNNWLRPYFGGDMIVPDWSKVEELQEDMGKLTDMLVKHIENGITTPYKAALKLYGEVDEKNPPKDEYYKKSSLQPADAPEQVDEVVTGSMIAGLKPKLTQCEYCGFEFDYNTIDEVSQGYVKCPECGRIINQQGNGN